MASKVPVKVKKPSKYHNQPVVINGIKFHSKKEGNRYQELLLMQRAGLISNLRRQVKYELIPAQHCEETGEDLEAWYYVADFVYEKQHRTIVEDSKGYVTDMYKAKKKAMFYRYGIWILET